MALSNSTNNLFEDTAPDAGLTDADIYAFIVANMGNPKAIADYAKTNSLTLSDLSRISTYPVDTVKAFLGADAAGIDTNPSKTIQIAGKSYKIDTGTVDNVYNQITAQGLMSQWKGEGFGTAERNARRMAEELVASGITDIKQVGQGTIQVPGSSYETEQGTVTTPDSSYTGLINKTTGQPLLSDYDRSGGNAFSGTYSGDGNTAYRVKFGSDGVPYFYTTADTSNDLAMFMKDIGPLGNIMIAVATGGLSVPQQIAAKFAIDVLSGNDLNAALKKAAISYAGAALPSTDFMKDANKYLLGVDSTGSLAKIFTGAAVGATTGLLSGQDLLDAALAGAKSGGITSVADVVMNNMDLSGLTANQKKALKTTITGTLSGKPLDQTLMNAVTGLASSEAKKAIEDNKKYAPLEQADIDELSEAEKAAYDADGTRGLLDYRRAQKAATTTSDAGTTGTGGIQVAGAGTGTVSDAGNGVFTAGEVTGRPIYAEDSRAANLEIPFGFRILSSSESDAKPTGSFFDATTNAWLAPSTILTNNPQVNADIALFNGAIGDLDAFAKTTADTHDDDVAAFLKSIGITSVDDLSSNLSNQDILDLINAGDLFDENGLLKYAEKKDDTVTVTTPGDKTTTTTTDTSTTGGGGSTTTTGTDTVTVTDCGPGKVRNAAGVCVPINCGVGKHWDPITGQCELDAAVTDTTTTTTTTTGGDDTVVVKSCPAGQERNAAGVCVPINCGTGKHWDPITGKCELDAIVPETPTTLTCGPGQKLSADGKSCVPDDTVVVKSCPAGQERNAAGVCVPINCGTGKHWDPITGKCELDAVVPETPTTLTCGPGQKLSADGKSCVPDDTVIVKSCPAGQERNAAGVCVPINCGVGKHWDAVTGKCELDAVVPPATLTCPPGQKLSADGLMCIPDTITVSECGPGKERNAAGVCVPINCGVGKHWDPITGQCELDAVVPPTTLTCPPGQKLSADGLSCVPDDTVVVTDCGPTKELGPDGKTCIEKCPPGWVRGADGITCVIAPVECNPYEEKNAAGVCVPKCAPGYKRGSDGVSCVPDDEVVVKSCPIGQERNAAGDCVPINCGVGRHFDPILNQCVDDAKIIDQTCPVGQHWDAAQGKCVADATTPVTPVTPTTPTTKTTTNNITNLMMPSVGGVTTDTTAPIYAKGMSDFDLFATLEDILHQKPAKKDAQQSQQDTKMATGGYLDNLLAEQMTVDDLLKLLR